ncbi:potassium channel family protein [Bizionia sp. KMM 8389]
MKYIVVGLGSFGASIAEKLTAHGNEVIGIDKNMAKVDAYKEKISHTICMDAMDELTVSGLPLKETDVVIIAIGENQGANVMATALFKNLEVKRLISRSINMLHEKVLLAIGVDEIVHPEQETAERWSKKLAFNNVVDSFELNSNYSIVEVSVPSKFVGKTIKDVELGAKYHLLALTTIKKDSVPSAVGGQRKVGHIQGVAKPHTVLEQGDILVVYGANSDLKNFITLK